jgi:Bacteriophage clamp loader A subunit
MSDILTPFDFINAISHNKQNLMDLENAESQYKSYVINKGLSFYPDTVIQANEMNSRPHLDRKMQFNFLINIIRSKKRYSKWLKPEKFDDLEVVQEYYGYSKEKARQVLPLFSNEQIDYLKRRIKKGGLDE